MKRGGRKREEKANERIKKRLQRIGGGRKKEEME